MPPHLSVSSSRLHPSVRVTPAQKRYIIIAAVFLVLIMLWATAPRPRQAAGPWKGHALQDVSQPLQEDGGGEAGWLHERMKMQLELETLRNQVKSLSLSSSAAPPIVVVEQSPPSTTAPAAQPLRQPSAALMTTSSEPWLVIGVPTIPRPGESPHAEWPLLRRTLWSYLRQFAAMDSDAGFHVIVMNLRGAGTHVVFDAVKREFLTLRADPFYRVAAKAFEFVDASHTYPDDVNAEGVVGPDGTHEPPTAKVRRQSLDVVSLLDEVVRRPSKYFLFTEDDFELCPNGVLALQYAVSKARRYSLVPSAGSSGSAGERPFSALRCGIGLNGIVMHNSAGPPYSDVAAFRSYLRRHYARRPPDHLVVEFYAQESDEARHYFAEDHQGRRRRVAAFRHNIFRHLGGRHSTLRDETAWSTPTCFTELIAPQVFEVEAWNPRDCPHDDMWPCDSQEARAEQTAPGGGVVVRWNVSSATQVSKHWVEAGEG